MYVCNLVPTSLLMQSNLLFWCVTFVNLSRSEMDVQLLLLCQVLVAQEDGCKLAGGTNQQLVGKYGTIVSIYALLYLGKGLLCKYRAQDFFLVSTGAFFLFLIPFISTKPCVFNPKVSEKALDSVHVYQSNQQANNIFKHHICAFVHDTLWAKWFNCYDT